MFFELNRSKGRAALTFKFAGIYIVSSLLSLENKFFPIFPKNFFSKIITPKLTFEVVTAIVTQWYRQVKISVFWKMFNFIITIINITINIIVRIPNYTFLTRRLSDETRESNLVRVIFQKRFNSLQVPKCNQSQIEVISFNFLFFV